MLTNAYARPGILSMTDFEKRECRINLAIRPGIGQLRVWSDLYQSLRGNDQVEAYGFIMKGGRNGLMTDNIIVYCGDRGFQSILDVVGGYCDQEEVLREGEGTPFGMHPFKNQALSVTADLKSDTFNGAQSKAIGLMFEKYAVDVMGKSLDALSSQERESLVAMIRSDAFRQYENLWKIDYHYEAALKEIGVEPNHHNIAFPMDIKKP